MLIILSSILIGPTTKADETLRTTPLPPAVALKQFQTAPGVRVELVATEPEVIDPVEIRFDERGRMWVVEMRGYPYGPPEGETPRSRIRVLEDRDGDGYFETARTFAQGLLLPTGLQPWGDGVIVTLAGRVVFLHDRQEAESTNGNAKTRPDEELWFTGFVEQNEQLRANHPRLAPDARVYIANGLRGGAVVDHRGGETSEPVEIRGHDVRFDPGGGGLEAISGPAQFGMTFDEFGRRYICSNRNPLMHVVLEGRPTSRNPFFALPSVLHDVAAAGGDSRVFALTDAWTTSMKHAGQFTAACGVHVYRGNALPARFRSQAFVCEPTGNLVRCELFEPACGTFRSHPPRDNAEFLASRDPWFRPVNIETGPDGALYVVDMHRAVIEHPDWMPEELRTRRDLLAGNQAGRIYRLVSEDDASTTTPIDVSRRSGRELASLLDHPNGWVRATAFRMIYQRHDVTAVATIKQLAEQARGAEGRAWSLWTLAALKSLNDEVLLKALNDKDASVAEVAVRLSEPWLTRSKPVRDAVLALADSVNDRLRFCVALTVGDLERADAVEALARIARRGSNDIWTRRAIATARPETAVAVTNKLLTGSSAKGASDDQGFHSLLTELCEMIGRSKNDAWAEAALVAAMEPGEWNDDAARHGGVAAMTGLARGLAASGRPLAGWMSRRPAQLEKSVARARRLILHTVEDAMSGDAPAEQRGRAIALLRYGAWDDVGQSLFCSPRAMNGPKSSEKRWPPCEVFQLPIFPNGCYRRSTHKHRRFAEPCWICC